ncbi:ABC transporter substrate-binding protein [Pseudoalteromonas sp. SG44-17]|uniref:ABC transporter substrate-binding protein n=1 Tax=Pseudoalteromonas sp. SG44-17 TaxID=2760963 RepID=UPI0015FEF163|nr:ABC transporter substrate-binding protein [Pseudoalteromonas sp. SG44-17]MBB1409844.1 ABC transporter substrate-binding protein [Pseudoalteromonas sp. SG44-17]
MQLLKIYWLVLLLCLIVSPGSFAALNITFINPGFAKQHDTSVNSTGEFWYKVASSMQAAANDLDINLTIHFASRNHIEMKALIAQAIKSKPDYLILVDEKKVLSDYLVSIKTNNIPIYFLLNRPDEVKLRMLKQHNIDVIGSVVSGNRDGGYKLAQALYQQHQKRHVGKMNILALLGDHTTPAAIKRRAGLDDFLATHPDVTIVAEDVANWSMEQSFSKTLAFLNAVPNVNAIWCANDAIGFGAINALNTQQRRESAVVGGFNWDKAPLTNMNLDVSMGGHVLLGAYAMIAISDEIKKPQQFSLKHEDLTFFTEKTPKAQQLIEHINQGKLHKIDFSKFSRSQAHPLKFTVDNLAKEIENAL